MHFKRSQALKYLVLFTFAFVSVRGCVPPTKVNDSVAEVQEVTTNLPNPMIHSEGTTIVDSGGNPIKLRGVMLEGWLMWNGPLWGAGLTSETKITQRLEKMAGKAYTEKFRKDIYGSFITERDIELIAEIGFNMVRVPFNHTILEDDNVLEDYSAVGWKYLDDLIDWCEKNEVYIILDFHSLPGGQGSFVSDPELINVWLSKEHQQRSIDIWGAIAKRYANEHIIAGYDLINEPDAPNGKALVDLHRRIIEEIRKVDPYHMIIIEGGKFSSDFSMYTGRLDDNQAYGFHSYNFLSNKTDEKNLRELSKIAIAHDVPLLNCEFGAHNSKWIEEELKLYEDPELPINGWVFWPWKRESENSDRFRHLGGIPSSEEWKQVAKSIADIFGPSKDISSETAQNAMDSFILSVSAENIEFDEEILAILRQHLSE